MKKFLALLLVTASNSMANNAPGDCTQIVRVIDRGPFIQATVGSACNRWDFVAYKQKAYLSQFGTQALHAIVVSGCYAGDTIENKKHYTISLGREWHGNGYMSAAFSEHELRANSCRPRTIPFMKVAFSDAQGHWDSLNGLNYDFAFNDLYQNSGVAVLRTTNTNPYDVAPEAYEFILKQLRK